MNMSAFSKERHALRKRVAVIYSNTSLKVVNYQESSSLGSYGQPLHNSP
jgi:hypothetical protein